MDRGTDRDVRTHLKMGYRWADQPTDGQMDGQTDGWTHPHICEDASKKATAPYFDVITTSGSLSDIWRCNTANISAQPYSKSHKNKMFFWASFWGKTMAAPVFCAILRSFPLPVSHDQSPIVRGKYTQCQKAK